MAGIGTRLHTVGSIYGRVRNMLTSGIMEWKDQPLWYDIYEAFPPKREPVHIPDPTPDEHGLIRVEDNVKPILYKEDWARASLSKLYKDFTSVYNLCGDSQNFNLSERFINTFLALHKLYPELSREEVFEKTEAEYNLNSSVKKV